MADSLRAFPRLTECQVIFRAIEIPHDRHIQGNECFLVVDFACRVMRIGVETNHQLRKGIEPMTIQAPPPAVVDIVRAIESRRGVTLAKE